MCPLCFQFGSDAYFHLDPSTSCQCKSGRTLSPINTDVRKDSLPLTPRGLISDRSLLLQRGSSGVGDGAAMNCKCETTDAPTMQTTRCAFGICMATAQHSETAL